MTSRRSCSLRLALIALFCSAVSAAHAQPSAADKETARALLLDGRAKMEARDFTAALKAFEAAHAIMGVPTTGLDLARAQEALGRLIEARETALGVTRIAASPGESPAFGEARKAAGDLAAQIAPRIPSLVITVRGADPAVITVKIDGAVIPAASLGLPRKVNAGHHSIELAAPGFAAVTREVDLVEKQTLPVELSVAPAPIAEPPASASGTASAAPSLSAAAPTAAVASAAPSSSAPLIAPPVPYQPQPVPAWVWVAGGASLVAFGVGNGFLADYADAHDAVAKECPGNVCPKLTAEEAQALRTRWNRGLGVGIALDAAGVAGFGLFLWGLLRKPASGPAAGTPAPALQIKARGAGFSIEGAF